MSQIDRSLDPVLRDQLLSEIRSFLPSYLSATSVERPGPIEVAAEIFELHRSDLMRVITIHALLSAPVRSFVEALPMGMRRPIAASTRPRVAERAVSSGIDWAATIRHRATASPLESTWVTRPARRVFDLPENQALAWLLFTIEDRGKLSRDLLDAPATSWAGEIQQSAATAGHLRRVAWLEGVTGIWPGDQVYGRLQADRWGFYSTKVAPAARFLRRMLNSPSEMDIVEALCGRYFEPSQDWKLFELAVLLRISRALGQVGERLGHLSAIGRGGRTPFVRFRLRTGRIVQIWYQGWPPTGEWSELQDAVEHYGLQAGSYSRPDIVVEFLDDDSTSRLIVLELKASSNPGYLGSGFAQLLSYLRERPTYTGAKPSGWLVTPALVTSGRESDGRSLWLVTADDVANAVVAAAANNDEPNHPPASSRAAQDLDLPAVEPP